MVLWNSMSISFFFLRMIYAGLWIYMKLDTNRYGVKWSFYYLWYDKWHLLLMYNTSHPFNISLHLFWTACLLVSCFWGGFFRMICKVINVLKKVSYIYIYFLFLNNFAIKVDMYMYFLWIILIVICITFNSNTCKSFLYLFILIW